MRKKMGEFCFGQSVRKLSESYGKTLFNETYFEESNINQKPLTWCKDKIKKNLDKKMGEFCFGQSI